MPSNHKNAHQGQRKHDFKLKHFEDSDGWTHVTRERLSDLTISNNRKGGVATDHPSSTTTCAVSKRLQREQSLQPKEPVRDLPNLRTQLRRVSQEWISSPTRQRLKTILEQKPHTLPPVRSFVSIGLGSPSADPIHVLWQLSCLLDLADLLNTPAPIEAQWTDEMTKLSVTGDAAPSQGLQETKNAYVEKLSSAHNTTKHIYARDPVFNTADHIFLEELGITVLEEPTAWRRIDDDTLLFAVHFPTANAPVGLFYSDTRQEPPKSAPGISSETETETQWVYEGPMPSVVICNDLSVHATSEESRVLCEYDGTRFPHPEHGSSRRRKQIGEEHGPEIYAAFNDTMLYIKNGDE